MINFFLVNIKYVLPDISIKNLVKDQFLRDK